MHLGSDVGVGVDLRAAFGAVERRVRRRAAAWAPVREDAGVVVVLVGAVILVSRMDFGDGDELVAG